jgi:hypothetical protein
VAKKKQSFELFLEAIQVFFPKEHLTIEGIEKLKQIRLK